MSSVVAFAFTYGGLFVALWLAAAWRALRPGSTAGRRLVTSVLVFYTLASVYVVPYSVSRILVGRFEPYRVGADVSSSVAILLLGSGAQAVTAWDGSRIGLLDPASAARVAEAARLYRISPNSWVISSGGRVSGNPEAITTGGTMRDALIQLGVPASRIIVEAESQSTRDEALLIAPLLVPLRPAKVVVATSDFHMRRSLGAFRGVGIEAVPAIARDPMLGRSWAAWLVPTHQSLVFSGSVGREFVALAAYWSRGWLQM